MKYPSAAFVDPGVVFADSRGFAVALRRTRVVSLKIA